MTLGYQVKQCDYSHNFQQHLQTIFTVLLQVPLDQKCLVYSLFLAAKRVCAAAPSFGQSDVVNNRISGIYQLRRITRMRHKTATSLCTIPSESAFAAQAGVRTAERISSLFPRISSAPTSEHPISAARPESHVRLLTRSHAAPTAHIPFGGEEPVSVQSNIRLGHANVCIYDSPNDFWKHILCSLNLRSRSFPCHFIGNQSLDVHVFVKTCPFGPSNLHTNARMRLSHLEGRRGHM